MEQSILQTDFFTFKNKKKIILQQLDRPSVKVLKSEVLYSHLNFKVSSLIGLEFPSFLRTFSQKDQKRRGDVHERWDKTKVKTYIK